MRAVVITVGAVGTNSVSWQCAAHSQVMVDSIFVEFTTSSTAGNRVLCVEVLDGDTVVGRVVSGVVQGASQSYQYEFSPSCPDLTAPRSGLVMTPLPVWRLRWGQSLRIRDLANIDGTRDSMRVYALGTAGG